MNICHVKSNDVVLGKHFSKVLMGKENSRAKVPCHGVCVSAFFFHCNMSDTYRQTSTQRRRTGRSHPQTGA